MRFWKVPHTLENVFSNKSPRSVTKSLCNNAFPSRSLPSYITQHTISSLQESGLTSTTTLRLQPCSCLRSSTIFRFTMFRNYKHALLLRSLFSDSDPHDHSRNPLGQALRHVSLLWVKERSGKLSWISSSYFQQFCAALRCISVLRDYLDSCCIIHERFCETMDCTRKLSTTNIILNETQKLCYG